MAKVIGIGKPLQSEALPVAGGDQTLQPLHFYLDTGNSCVVTPTVKGDSSEMRVAFLLRFTSGKPSPEELAAVQTAMLLGHEKEFSAAVKPQRVTEEEGKALGEHFLSGKKPQ